MLHGLSKLARSGRTPIGLDIGAHTIKAAQFVRSRSGSLSVHASASFSRSARSTTLDAAEARRIVGVLTRRGFDGNQVVLAVPPASLLSAALELPARTGEAPLDLIARSEFARTHKRDADTFEFAYWELPAAARANRGTQALAVACPHAGAEALLQAADAASLDICALEAEPCVLARLADTANMLAPAGQVTSLLDLGHTACRVAIVHQNRLVYTRSLPEAGLGRLHESLKAQLGLDAEASAHLLETVGLSTPDMPADAAEAVADARRLLTLHLNTMIQELRVSFSYAGHQYPEFPMSRVLLAGGGAEVPGLPEWLAKSLGFEVFPMRAIANLSPSLAMAAGLSLFDGDF